MAEKAALGSWSTGFCDCCSDWGSCCLTLWCPCVSFGRIAEIVDGGTTSCCQQGTVFCVLGGFTHFVSLISVPLPHLGYLYSWIYRTKMRRLYGIKGNKCRDCLASCLCPHMSICQEYRELKARGFDVSAGWQGNVQMGTRGVTAAPAVEGGMSR